MSNHLAVALRELRQKKGASLRTAESETGISNAYLSQLERGIASNPTPSKLRSLAEYYEVAYLDLLNLAGYLPAVSGSTQPPLIASLKTDNVDHSLLPFNPDDLSEEEEALVLQYIEFLKSRRNHTSHSSST